MNEPARGFTPDVICLPGYHYTRIADVVNDAMERKDCFVAGIQVDFRYVLTSTIEHLQELIARGKIRRAVEVSPL